MYDHIGAPVRRWLISQATGMAIVDVHAIFSEACPTSSTEAVTAVRYWSGSNRTGSARLVGAARHRK